MPTLPKSKRLEWQEERKPQGRRLVNDSERYNTKDWRDLSLLVKYQEPICRMCEREATYYTDHIIPVKQGGAFLDRDNLQGLCKRCHGIKSGRESHTKNKQ